MSNANDLKSWAEEMAAAYMQRMQDITRIGAETRTFLKDCERSMANLAKKVDDLRAAADALVDDLGEQNADSGAATGVIVADSANADGARAKEVADIRAAARAMLEEFAAEHAAATKAWQDLLKRMKAVRSGKHPREKAEPEGAIGNELVEEIEEVLSPVQLKRKVLSLIKRSKDDGIKLAAVARELGLESWRSLVPVTQELIEEGEVEKKGPFYFAT